MCLTLQLNLLWIWENVTDYSNCNLCTDGLFSTISKSQDSLDQWPMPINANQNSGIDPNTDQCRSVPINSDQCWSMPVQADRHWSELTCPIAMQVNSDLPGSYKWSALRGILDQSHDFGRHWSMLDIDRGIKKLNHIFSYNENENWQDIQIF